VPAASPDARRSSLRRRLGLLAPLVALGLVVTGCSTPGQPKDFNADVKDGFMAACEAANEDEGSVAEVADACGCWFDALSGDDGISFDQFKQDDENIRDAIDKGEFNDEADFQRVAPSTYRVIKDNCQEAVGPTAG
jgi:hypothetical protein